MNGSMRCRFLISAFGFREFSQYFQHASRPKSAQLSAAACLHNRAKGVHWQQGAAHGSSGTHWWWVRSFCSSQTANLAWKRLPVFSYVIWSHVLWILLIVPGVEIVRCTQLTSSLSCRGLKIFKERQSVQSRCCIVFRQIVWAVWPWALSSPAVRDQLWSYSKHQSSISRYIRYMA